MVKDAKILILGLTFKENCPDIRNTKVIDIYHTLREYTGNIDVCDPWADQHRVKEEFGIDVMVNLPDEKYDAVVLAVAHEVFKSVDVSSLKRTVDSVVYDVKGFLDRALVDGRL
jgi:UDP-N-acetyl-D-galactosamine dehydrogenase